MSLYEKLYDWQREIIDKIDTDSFGFFLGCGFGKTIMSLALAEKNKCDKVIVISIAAKAEEDENVNGSWLYWAKQSDINYHLYNKSQQEFNVNEPEILLINYESLFSRGNNIKSKAEVKDNIKNFCKSSKGHNVAIIIDESHKMKNLQSKQTCCIFKIKTLLNMYAKEVYSYLLTGTPFTTGYIDLYSQLKFLGCSLTKTQFIDDFCVKGNKPGLLGWQQPIIGYKNIDKLYNLVHKYAITYKTEDFVKLPDKIFNYYTLPISQDMIMYISEQQKPDYILSYAKKRKVKIDVEVEQKKVNNPFYRNLDYPSSDFLAETAGAFWMRSRQLSIGFQGNAEQSIWFDKRRILQLKKFLETNEDNYIIFYNYTPEMLDIYEVCEELGYNIDVYCGEVKSEFYYNKYSTQSEAEKLTNKKNVLIANFASGGTGKNWQAYNQCIIFSVPLYKDYEQGIGRVYRLGQKETTIFHFFYQDNWLDKSMLEALQQNIQYSDELFKQNLEKFSKSIKI